MNADALAEPGAANGGNGLGGAVFLSTDAAGVPLPTVFILCDFPDCSAVGGASRNTSGAIRGGQNGAGYGGGIYIGAGVFAYDFIVFFNDNQADFGPDDYGVLARRLPSRVQFHSEHARTAP